MENKTKENQQEIRKPDEDIIEGALTTDQLEKLQPDKDEEKNTNKHQAGTPPLTDVDKGEGHADA